MFETLLESARGLSKIRSPNVTVPSAWSRNVSRFALHRTTRLNPHGEQPTQIG